MNTNPEHYAHYAKIDIMAGMQELNNYIYQRGAYEQATGEELLEKIQIRAQQMEEFITNYLGHNRNYVHEQKRHHLHQAAFHLQELKNKAHALQSYNKQTSKLSAEQIDMLNKFWKEVSIDLWQYAESGSSYLFRHCTKQKTGHRVPDKRFKKGFRMDVFDDIASTAYVDEAYHRAEGILEEVLLSPKPVHIYFYWSEMARAKHFAHVIEHVVKKANHYGAHHVFRSDKLVIHHKRYDKRIRFNYWDKEALAEASEAYAQATKRLGNDPNKGGWYCVEHWMKGDAEFATMKHQPLFRDVENGVNDFLVDANKRAQKDTNDHYTITVGVSHSWVIDAVLIKYFPQLLHNGDHMIREATFCKVENNDFCYLGHWVNFHHGFT